jgi:hypothetical protein
MRFRKKPVVIEAVQFDGTYKCFIEDIEPFCEGNTGPFVLDKFTIHTLEGNHTASPGDWIIKGIKGEFYPCKPDIFEATYELAEPVVEPAR